MQYCFLFFILNLIFTPAQKLNIISGGAQNSSNNNFSMNTAVGQPLVINSSQKKVNLESGFWPAVNAHRNPSISFNSRNFNLMAMHNLDLSFYLIINNSGNYPGNYYIKTAADYESFTWLLAKPDSIRIGPEESALIQMQIRLSDNFPVGSIPGYILVDSNTGPGRSIITDSLQILLNILPDSTSILTADIAMAADDSSIINIMDSNGQSLALSLKFSKNSGGTISAKYISDVSFTDSSSVCRDPDSIIGQPRYIDCFWEIGTTLKPGFSVDLAFDYSQISSLNNIRDLRLAKRPGYAPAEHDWQIISMDSTNLDSSSKIITALDQSNFSQWTIISDKNINIEEDLQPPSIINLHNYPEIPALADSILITAEIKDEKLLERITLIYGQGGDSLNNLVEMDLADTVYQAQIPGEDVSLKGLIYFIQALDQSGNLSISDSQYLQVKFASDILSSNIKQSAFPLGLPQKKWRLISVPAELKETQVRQVFADELQEQGGPESWKILTWNGSEWINVSQMFPGTAAWIYQQTPKNVEFSSGSGRSTDLKGLILSLPPGWSLIASPYVFEISAHFDPTDFYGPLAYGIDGEGWSNVNVLKPWGGYAIFNRRNEYKSLHLKPDPFKSSADAPDYLKILSPASTADAHNQQQWILRLMVEGEIFQDNENYLGRISGARENIDFYDNPEPPYIGGFISLSMDSGPEKNNKPAYSELSADFRSLLEKNGIWHMNLVVKGENGPLRFQTELQGFSDPEMDILLLDMETRNVFDLRENTEFLISKYSQTEKRVKHPYKLKVMAGTREFVSKTLNKILENFPRQINLAQNYPNPFNSFTCIKFDLPTSQMVNIKIYNILGQEVAALVKGWRNAGQHEIYWNGRDSYAREVSSGLYFSALITEEKVFMRKMILLR